MSRITPAIVHKARDFAEEALAAKEFDTVGGRFDASRAQAMFGTPAKFELAKLQNNLEQYMREKEREGMIGVPKPEFPDTYRLAKRFSRLYDIPVEEAPFFVGVAAGILENLTANRH